MNSPRFRAVAALLAVLAAPLGAQSILRFHLNPPKVEAVAGLQQHVQNGELHLTLDDFLQMVLVNDTNIHLLRLSDDNARYAVLAARSPFDPQLTASFNGTRSVQPQTSQTSGAATLSSLRQTSSIGFSQMLSTGQTFQASFGSNRNSSNSAFSTYNPSVGADVNFSFTQSLLRNRGNLQNRTAGLVARTQVVVVGDQTQTQIADELVTAANQYWNTVGARDQIKVRQAAVDLAQKSYERDENALKLGALAPGDIFSSQSQVAQDQTALLQAQSTYKQQLDRLRRLIGADLDPAARAAQIILDDDPTAVTPTPPTLNLQEATQQALQHRPELDALQRQQLEDQFSINQAHDLLRPQLDLTGQYGSNGLAGNQTGSTTLLGTIPASQSGFGNALNQVFNFGSPTYGFNLQLTLPLRDSRSEATLANALVAQTNHAYQLRNEEQQVRQDVSVADTQLRMAVEVVKSATLARDLAQKNVDAYQQKYTLGSITVFELLQAQVQLSDAQSTLLSAYTSYQIAEIAYERALWTLLPKLHLTVAP
ncbi:MAG TPA: TolC family protein [Terriglobales bacterium]